MIDSIKVLHGFRGYTMWFVHSLNICTLGVSHSIQRSTSDQRGTMSSKRALQRAKRMKQSVVLMYIHPFFRSSYVFS